MRRVISVTAAVAVLGVLPPANSGLPTSAAAPSAKPGATAMAGAIAADVLSRQGPSFEQNLGQFAEQVRFVSRGPGYTLFLTETEAVFDLETKVEDNGEKPEHEVIRMAFDGAASSPAVETSNPRSGVSNYLTGSDPDKWVTKVPSFGRITYRNLYPGIDLVFRGNDEDELEYDFVVAPGADPSQIGLRYSGQNALSIANDGGLLVGTSAGHNLEQEAPVVFQEVDGRSTTISGAFKLEGHVVGFGVGSYDASRPLIIDPVITYSTYLSGAANDEATAVALDTNGNAYVTGKTCSADFPVKSADSEKAPPQQLAAGEDQCDAFVTKMAPDGTLVYSTYLGGSPPATEPYVVQPAPTTCGDEWCYPARAKAYPNPDYEHHEHGTDAGTAVSADAVGRAFVVGYTHAGNFPTTGNAYDRSCGGSVTSVLPDPEDQECELYRHIQYEEVVTRVHHRAIVHNYWVPDAFVTRLSPDGSALEYSTYLGGPPNPKAHPLTYQGPRELVHNTDDTPTPGTDTSKPLASGADIPRGASLDANGNLYVTGATTSEAFPATANAYDRECGTDGRCDGWYFPDVFVTKFDTQRGGPNSLLYSTFLGGPRVDSGTAVVMADGNGTEGAFYVAGRAQNQFPTTPAQVLQSSSTASGCPTAPYIPYIAFDFYEECRTEGFIAKIDPGAPTPVQSLLKSTYLNVERLSGLAVDGAGNPYITGCGGNQSNSATWCIGDSAARPSPPESTKRVGPGGVADAVIAKVAPDFGRFDYYTLLGGTMPDAGSAIAVDTAGSAYVTGTTASDDFPSKRRFQGLAHSGNCVPESDRIPRCGDLFVVKLAPSGSDAEIASHLGGTGLDVPRGMVLGSRGDLVLAGSTTSGDFPTTETAHQPSRIGGLEGFVTSINVQSTLHEVHSLAPDRGPTSGGTSVTISGNGLTGAEQVYFGARPATSFDVNPEGTQIVAISPAQPERSVRVRVKKAGAMSAAPLRWSTFVYEEGTWVSERHRQEGTLAEPAASGQTATVLDHPGCHVADPPAGFQYPCGAVLVVGPTGALLFDPHTGLWNEPNCTTSQSCPASPARVRHEHTSTLLRDGRVLVVGGNLSRSAEVYDPLSGTWSRTGDMRQGRSGHTATVLPDGRVMVAGGESPNTGTGGGTKVTADVEIFDAESTGVAETISLDPAVAPVTPTKGAWSPVMPMTEARVNHTATLLTGPNCAHARCGWVLVTGGSNAGVATSRAELFDPEKGRWISLETNPAFARTLHTATLLPDGKVLFVGGGAAIAETFDPGVAHDAAWSFAGSIRADRRGHVALLLPNDKVLVTGGLFGVPDGTLDKDMTELYEIADGTWMPSGIAERPAAGFDAATVLSGRGDRFEANQSCKPRCGWALVVNSRGYDLYIPAPSVTSLSPASADSAGGTDLVFTGTGFDTDAKVFFDGHEVEDVIVGNYYIGLTAKSPAMGTNVRPDVWVANAGGPTRVKAPFRYTGPPSEVGPLRARGAPDQKLDLLFSAAGSVGTALPAATAYQVRRSPSEIRTSGDFDVVDVLVCAESTPAGDCLLEPSVVGETLSVSVDAPPAGRTRYYAVRAVNDDGEAGPFATASYTSPGTAVDEEITTVVEEATLDEKCQPIGHVAQHQLVYPTGYSLVGVPWGTVVGSDSPLYSWLDQGAGGNYTTTAASAPTEVGRGYWAWFSCPKLVELAGGGADSATLPLGAYRASMVGNPSALAPATVTGHDFAARWDPNLNAGVGGYNISAFREAQELAVGEGMWAFSYLPTELSIRSQ